MPLGPLDSLRHALRGRDHTVRLLVPTATMAEHLQNQLAREGLVFPRRVIQTLSGFVEGFVPELRQAPETVLYLIVEEAARRAHRPEFERVVHMPGFCASLARVIAEFSSAGCDSARLASCLPEAPLAEAFLEVYRETDCELARRGLVLRARRLEAAAARIEAEGLGGIRAVWLDGFHALPDPEQRFIRALEKHAEVTVAPAERHSPAVAIVRAPSVERECDEIARRILEQAAAGRPFRETGIIVRAAEAYVPILRSTLERFGIPARFYFDEELERHPAVRFLTGAVDAMLGGWDHAATLAVLRLAPRFLDFNALDRLDFAVREQIPNAGLGALHALTDSAPLQHKLEALGKLEEWRSFVLSPRDWAARLGTLRNLFRPGVQEPATHDLALLHRSQAAALDAFDEALGEAALALEPGRSIALEDFWRAVMSVVRLKPLRLRDGRRNVVRVLSAPEARQWALPVVFVCGMVEKQFPQFHRQDPFFPDVARARLNDAGVRVRTAAQFEREERELFDAAVTRATLLATLTYPEFDARGDRNLPSLYLDTFAAPAESSRAVRPQPRHTPLPPARAAIETPALLEFLRDRTVKVSPTGLETYLQCPFQYFAGRVLRLRTAPPRPAERLDFLTQGNIVHEVLAAWWQEGGDIAGLFENVFARIAGENSIPVNSYQTERVRNAMVGDLRRFAADTQWARDGYQSRIEEKFQFEIAPGLFVTGKIDRLDTQDGAAFVFDYKYSNAQRTKDRGNDESLLQAPLYAMAAENFFHLHPAGMFYIGVKGEVNYIGWSESRILASQPIPDNWFQRTTDRALAVIGEIRGGRVEPLPADPAKCRWCDVRDVCRIDVKRAPAPMAEGA